ncbi:patatin-like phospholipase family protein [Desulfobotulus sp. H1]|uniref:Patatin-like phospholipase family protein n=1 Tax=Desulfobotulus pelophilus TaxID=2823377 RepID=A0ABT3N5T0_9BACT|nr:patatin-like phospholipase family protein [Desulfobotulus pelophilus]MCW7752521.1 patatin-like phospholipase family protein [Desulfobotulus pelophilus]
MKPLLFLAGPRAYKRIREKGLGPDDVRLVLGASGAAKWLGIHGLDVAVFSDFLTGSSRPVPFFGTSIGAWKLAAATRKDPRAAFDFLAHAYMHQFYKKPVRRRHVDQEALRIVDAFLPPGAAREILSHPKFRLHLSVIRCNGALASENAMALAWGLGMAFTVNWKGRSQYIRRFDRVIFHDPREESLVNGAFNGASSVPLTPENFRSALLATGSIPFLMSGVPEIPGAGEGTFRDGGLVDYHPLPPEELEEGIVLYPHFYPEVIPGWFDKRMPRRRASAMDLADVLLLAPSSEYVEKLPFGRIPDRRDFKVFEGNDAARLSFWKKAVAESRRLGDAFLEALENGRIEDCIQPMGMDA